MTRANAPSDRSAVVTGAAAGIGRATALRLCRAGWTVVAVDRDGAGLEALRRESQEEGHECITACSDVGDWDAPDRILADKASGRPPLKGLVAAAGISFGKTLLNTAEDELHDVFRTNVVGVAAWCRSAVSEMREVGGGAIVTIASQVAIRGAPSNMAYTLSKSAVVGLTRSIAIDYGRDNIRANSIAPGAIESAMQERFLSRAADPDAARLRSLESRPLKRFGQPEEVAATAEFLMSDEASFITGAVVPVEGGSLAQ